MQLHHVFATRLGSHTPVTAASIAPVMGIIHGRIHVRDEREFSRAPTAPNYPHKLTNRRSVGSAAEPLWPAPNCSASRRLHIAPFEFSFSRGSHRAAVGQARGAACSLE